MKNPLFCAALGVLISFSALTPSNADNRTALDSMKDVAGSLSSLSEERRSRIAKVIDESLHDASEFGKDKEEKCGEQFRYYLSSQMSGLDLLDDEDFEFRMETLAWALGNFSRMPELSEADRERGRSAFRALAASAREFIDQAYRDTPGDVREKLAREVAKKVDIRLPQVGNYFFPTWLLTSLPPLSSQEVVDALRKDPFLQDRSQAFASVASILADETLPVRSREVHVDFFVDRESNSMLTAFQNSLMRRFELGSLVEKGLYRNWDKDLQEKSKRLQEKRIRAAQEKAKNFDRDVSREALLRDLTANTDLGMIEKSLVFAPSTEMGETATSVSTSSVPEGPRKPATKNPVAPETSSATTQKAPPTAHFGLTIGLAALFVLLLGGWYIIRRTSRIR